MDAELTVSEEQKSPWAYLSEAEIMRIRDKSRLPRYIKDEIRGEPFYNADNKFDKLLQYRRANVQRYYGKYGRKSGLNPGVCWGSIEENEYKIKKEQTFYPDLKTLMENDRKEREAETKRIADARKDIGAKLKKLPAAIEEFWRKVEEKKLQELEEQQKREKVIQEGDYLSFSAILSANCVFIHSSRVPGLRRGTHRRSFQGGAGQERSGSACSSQGV